MNLTQNDRLKQVTSDTLIVGVDVGSQTHFSRAFDWRGFEFSHRVFKFSNTGMGFLTFLRWTEELMNKTKMKKVIVDCEPTGCYWLTFQKFLLDHDIQLVTVNPFTVNRSMELDDNSSEKSDLKDLKTIALLVETCWTGDCKEEFRKKKGQPRISKRGRRKPRRTMYESARALISWNPAFQDVFLYYRNRERNPFGGMQAKIAAACKAIRIFYVVLQTGCGFDEERFRRDIIRPETA